MKLIIRRLKTHLDSIKAQFHSPENNIIYSHHQDGGNQKWLALTICHQSCPECHRGPAIGAVFFTRFLWHEMNVLDHCIFISLYFLLSGLTHGCCGVGWGGVGWGGWMGWGMYPRFACVPSNAVPCYFEYRIFFTYVNTVNWIVIGPDNNFVLIRQRGI